jgi:hypothetical protein
MATPVEWILAIGVGIVVIGGIYTIVDDLLEAEDAEDLAEDVLETQEDQSEENYELAVEEINEMTRLSTKEARMGRTDQREGLVNQYAEIEAANDVYNAVSGVDSGSKSLLDREKSLESDMSKNLGVIDRNYKHNMDKINTQHELNMEKAELGLEHNLENAQLNYDSTLLQIPSAFDIVATGVLNMGSDLVGLGMQYFSLTGGTFSDPGTNNNTPAPAPTYGGTTRYTQW